MVGILVMMMVTTILGFFRTGSSSAFCKLED
jgi:hypothetical protein